MKCKNKWEKCEDFSKMQVEKRERISDNGINFNSWNAIPEVALMGSREQVEEL